VRRLVRVDDRAGDVEDRHADQPAVAVGEQRPGLAVDLLAPGGASWRRCTGRRPWRSCSRARPGGRPRWRPRPCGSTARPRLIAIDGEPTATSVEVEDGRIARIYVMRNPRKLTRLEERIALTR
jgi:hypothetical protein